MSELKNLYYESQDKYDKPRPFEEIQRLDPVWTWILGFDTLILFIIFIISGVPWWSFILMAGITAFVGIFLSKLELKTRIDHEGIHFNMNQLFSKKHTLILWNDVEKISLRKLAGFTERSGYGMKGTKKKSFYNLRGNEAIDILLKDGRQVVIGTRKGHTIKKEERP